MKIVYLFSIYYFFFSLLVQLPVIFKDNSLFSLSTISLSITSIEERKGKGNETRFLGISISGLLKKTKKKRTKRAGTERRRRQSWCLICVSKVPCLSEFRFVFSGISCYPCFYSITHLPVVIPPAIHSKRDERQLIVRESRS